MQWCVVLVEDEYVRLGVLGVGLTALLPDRVVGGDATDIRWDVGGLPSHMFRIGYHPGVVSESRLVPDPGRVHRLPIPERAAEEARPGGSSALCGT